MEKIKVLFLCIHNSARSQMAEAYLKKYGDDYFDVMSAGLEPGILNPLVVESMKNDGIDISGNQTKDVFELYSAGKIFDFVITVCDAKNSERCPVFPGEVKKLHWDFEDPSLLTGSNEEKMIHIKRIRDQIKMKVIDFISQWSIREIEM